MVSEFNTPDDIFKCQNCGDCCTGFGGTYVTEKDIKKISEYIKVDAGTFVSKFCIPSGNRHVLAQGNDDKCIFFDIQKQCTIHPVKPYMCKAWPFIPVIIKHPENWDAMANSCPGMNKNIPHRTLKKIVSQEIRILRNEDEITPPFPADK